MEHPLQVENIENADCITQCLPIIDESPQSRLLHHGTSTLTDAELLSLLIGSLGAHALDVARKLLARHGGLTRMASCDASTLMHESDLGLLECSTILAAFELGRRIQVKQFNVNDQIKLPKDVADRYVPLMRDLAHEEFWVIHLNKANVILRHVVIAKGGVSASVVDAHEVFRLAILDRASSVILLHNHPSGNPEPSREDVALTRGLCEAGKTLQLPVFDHIIVAGSQFTSLRERGMV